MQICKIEHMISLHDDQGKNSCSKKKERHCIVTVNDKNLRLKVDTGTKHDVMSQYTYDLIKHIEDQAGQT